MQLGAMQVGTRATLMRLGLALEMARKKQGMTLQRAARAINVSVDDLAAMEGGRVRPALTDLVALLIALNLTARELQAEVKAADPVTARLLRNAQVSYEIWRKARRR